MWILPCAGLDLMPVVYSSSRALTPGSQEHRCIVKSSLWSSTQPVFNDTRLIETKYPCNVECRLLSSGVSKRLCCRDSSLLTLSIIAWLDQNLTESRVRARWCDRGLFFCQGTMPAICHLKMAKWSLLTHVVYQAKWWHIKALLHYVMPWQCYTKRQINTQCKSINHQRADVAICTARQYTLVIM